MKSLFKLQNCPKRRAPRLYFFIPGLLMLTGCGPVASDSMLPSSTLQSTESQSEVDQSYQGSGSYSSNLYQQRLAKVEALIRSGDNATAKRHVESINPLDLTVEQQAQLNLLNAQILLGTGDAEMAIKWLAVILPEQLDVKHKIEYLQSQAFAFSITGKPYESARARAQLSDLLASPQDRQENQAAILESLATLPGNTLGITQYSANDPMAGWMALARIMKSKGQPGFNERLAKWRQIFPDHPANTASLEVHQENSLPPPSQDYQGQTTSIAIFLPESGSFAEAAQAIRAGITAAYNDKGSKVHNPVIHFYDTEKASPLFLYNQAVTEGADMIIGPLEKESIQRLADAVTLQVPVLALNHVPGLLKDNLYQFGLSPMDDVGDITRRAWLDGHRNALLLTPDNSQGNRIGSYFVSDWEEIDGRIVEKLTYNPKSTDYSDVIKKLLNLDESEFRINKIKEVFPTIKFTPRRRQDADVLFLNANSVEARSINPLFLFYQASDLPVYATSNVYTGQDNSSLDSDLNAITFCDIPWFLNRKNSGSLSMAALNESWQSFPDSFLRLFAMGMDAYQLIAEINSLETSAFDGATGTLSLVSDNRIKRKLTCAKFIAGVPEATEASTTQEESNDIPAPDSNADSGF